MKPWVAGVALVALSACGGGEISRPTWSGAERAIAERSFFSEYGDEDPFGRCLIDAIIDTYTPEEILYGGDDSYETVSEVINRVFPRCAHVA